MSRLLRFLPPQVADLIVASGSEKQLESHRREITALFRDLRGFTGFTESADAEDVMALLRDYHAAIGEISSSTTARSNATLVAVRGVPPAAGHRPSAIRSTSPMRSTKASDRARSVKCRLRSRSYNSPNGAICQ